MRTSRPLLLLLALTACAHAPALAPSPAAPADALEAMREKVMRALDSGDGEALFALYDDAMQRALGPEATHAFAANARSDGPYALVAPLGSGKGGRSWHLKGRTGEWKLAFALGPDGRIAGMHLGPMPSAAPVRESGVPLRLPFEGSWLVFWGGSTAEVNQHVEMPNQRRASDLLVVEQGKSHRTDGKRPDDYYAYGRDVLAVAEGEVVTAVDGMYDSELGVMNSYDAVGNIVILELQPDLYAMYAHLLPGSVKVKAGERVRAGQVLGRCGNSGRSSEPHLHFQLQDGPRLESSLGVEPVFTKVRVTRDGKTEVVSGYHFLKGDLIEQP